MVVIRSIITYGYIVEKKDLRVQSVNEVKTQKKME